MSANKSSKPWEYNKQGDGSEADALSVAFLESLSYDWRIFKEDIKGSLAHAHMLCHVGLIAEKDLDAITSGLAEIQAEIEAYGDKWSGWKPELEDIHMCIESALIERIGDPGRKLHTGRSRNDQVILDMILWIQNAFKTLCAELEELMEAFYHLAEKDGHIVMPSYTHLQKAQPIVAGGELLGWAEAFYRCRNRIQSLASIHQESPLGAGAIAGSSLPLDRRYVSAFLGLNGITLNSMDSTASRDSIADMLYCIAMIGMTLSRWSEQWILYNTFEFGTIKIDSAYTTGSSMMPQKQNPDMLELIRGRCGTVYGQLFGMLTNLKGLPFGYNRDLQEDKRLLFAAYDIVSACLRMARKVVDGTRFMEDRISARLEEGFIDATIVAEYFVGKGIPFRTAHQLVGHLVKVCMENDLKALHELTLHAVQSACADFGMKDIELADFYDWSGAKQAVSRYVTEGNCGESGFSGQMSAWKERLDLWRQEP